MASGGIRADSHTKVNQIRFPRWFPWLHRFGIGWIRIIVSIPDRSAGWKKNRLISRRILICFKEGKPVWRIIIEKGLVAGYNADL